jgi:hypothetical protein
MAMHMHTLQILEGKIKGKRERDKDAALKVG